MHPPLKMLEISIPQRWIRFFQKLSAEDIKKLVVRTTTNFEIDKDVVSRIKSESQLNNFPTHVSSYPDYQDPQPSTSLWPQNTVQYQSLMGERDPLKLESPYLHLSETMGPYGQPSVSDNYSPDTVRTLFSPVTDGSY